MIEPTAELADKLARAQMAWAHELSGDDHWTRSDDGYDYCRSALLLAVELMEIRIDSDLRRLGELLNTPGAVIENYASDGICNAVGELDCAGLQFTDD
jgi:hypothetical protein